MALQEQLVLQVQTLLFPALQDLPDRKVHPERKASRVTRARLAHKDHKDPLALTV